MQERLTDYVNGDLPETERHELELHLEACVDCRGELESERELIRLAREWRRDVEPERDLWPGIESAISTPRRVVSGPWLTPRRIALAAAAALVAAVTLFVVRQAETPAAVPTEAMRADTFELVPTVDESRSLALASERARVEGGLMHVREDLLRTIHLRRDDLDPETREMVDRNLEIIDRAIGEIYRELERNPDNRVLEQLLAETYQREAEFLKQINTL